MARAVTDEWAELVRAAAEGASSDVRVNEQPSDMWLKRFEARLTALVEDVDEQ